MTVAFGGNRALDGVALSAEPGRVTGLIGPNGAGKSTLFDVASGLRRPSCGQVFLDGQDVTRTSPRAVPGADSPAPSSGWSSSAD
ncbi:ATP-binding cassette domain-containing protein [Streptomyces mirabilis]|nr:ATP-binding cassette domain-containing protein [Streptomyces mirabilis]